jgi:hypothetical protein
VRQRDLVQRAARGAQAVQRALDGGANLRVEALTEVLVGNADAQAADGLGGLGCVAGNRQRGGCRVHRVRTGEDFEHRRGVCHTAREGTDAIQRRGEGDEPVARDAAISGQHADDTAEGSGLANGTSGVGAERGDAEASGDRGRGTARRSAGNAVQRTRIVHRAVSRVLVGGAHRELVAVELAEQHSACGLELRYGGRVVGRMIALEDERARGRRNAANGEHILDRNRNAGERAERVAGFGCGIDLGGLREGAVAGESEIAVDARIDSSDALVVLLRERDSGDASGGDFGARLG